MKWDSFLNYIRAPWDAILRWPWLRQVQVVLYAAAGLSLVWGQYRLLTGRIPSGLGLTLVAGVLLLLTLVNERTWAWMGQAIRLGLERLELVLRHAHQVRKDTDKTAEPVRVSSAEFHESGADVASFLSRLQGQELFLPKKAFIIAGALLLILGQPLLLLERFFLSLLILGPGVFLLLYAFFSREERIFLGRLDVLYKTLLLALPGLACMIIGNFLLLKFVHTSMWKETLGIAFNAAGILLILALLPNTLPDPEPDAVPALDQLAGLATNRSQIFIKVALVLGATILFFLFRGAVAEGNIPQSLLLGGCGLLALGLSFPWARLRSETSEPGVLVGFGLKLGRMLLFVLALVLGYQGQGLIAQEKLYPGLIRFGIAVLALIMALRESRPNQPDRQAEKPLAWYWEALGLVVLMGVGFWLRTRLLDIMPYGVECDEAGGGVHALDVIEGRFNSLTAHPVGRPLFMLLDKVITISIWGIGNIGMRAGSVFFGVVGIFTLYIMIRHFFGPRVGLATAALMTLSRVHIHFSRYGFSNALFIVLLMLGFYFLVKGLSSRRKWHFVLSGVAFSLSIQTETAARLVPFIGLGILIYFLVMQKRFLQRNWRPALAFFLGVWLGGASIYIYFTKNSHVLLRRVQEVSIYSGDPNAPRDALKGFIDSAKISLTQFNWHGDYRTRHNGGLSGEPVFDFWTAILFLLGIGYACYHWRRVRYFIPLIWFFGFMSASVFALEAPQTHRAFGMFPAAFIFIAAVLDRGRRLVRETFGAPGAVASGLAFCLLLIPIGRTNYQKYFDTFPAFDTNCTAAARFIGGQNPDAEHIIMTAYLWQGHPPFQLYAGNISGRFYFSAAEVLPMTLPTDRDVVYTFLLEYPPLLPTVQWFYPNGKYFEEVHSKYGPQFQAWRVPQSEIQRTRGLNARYGSGSRAVVRKDANLDLAWNAESWPLAGPGDVSWEGTLMLPHGGEYIFYLQSSNPAEVRIGRSVRLRADAQKPQEQPLWMAGGMHRLSAQARNVNAGSTLQLSWSGHTTVPYYIPGPYRSAFPKEPIPATQFTNYPEPVGLLGTYYPTEMWQGKPLKQDIDPALLFVWMGAPFGFSRPLSMDWKGWINIQKDGEYRFDLTQSGYGEVEIDGQTVLSQGPPPEGWKPRTPLQNPIRLTPGRHPIVVRWVWRNNPMFKFWWTQPGESQEIVPVWVLSPAEP